MCGQASGATEMTSPARHTTRSRPAIVWRTGSEPTPEGLGRVIMGLAKHIKKVEKRLGTKVPGLMTHQARVEAFGNGVF